MKRYGLPLVTLLVLGWSLGAAEVSAQALPPRQLQAARLLERFGCVLDEPSMVILVCSALEDGKWVGAAPCGFEVAKCSQPQWVQLLEDRQERQRTRLGDFAPHNGEKGESTLDTSDGTMELVSVSAREHESLEGKLKRIRRSPPRGEVSSIVKDSDGVTDTAVLWVSTLQEAYLAAGCADDSDSEECVNSPYQQHLREIEADESVVRIGGE